MFDFMLPCNVVLFFTFLYELTFYDVHMRTRIFKKELTKVFFTIVAVYFIAIIFSRWVQSLVFYAQAAREN
jgi:hypothetical protein